MGLDIRWPIGLMFTLIGAIMAVFGLVTGSNAELYKRSLDLNVNLYWGLLLLAFGAWMLTMAWRGAQKAAQEQSQAKPAQSQQPAGRR